VTQLTPPYSWFRGDDFYKSDDVQKIYRYIEYMKWRFDAEWYTTLVGKLVLKTQAKIGILDQWSDPKPASALSNVSNWAATV
jgi:outer membrane protein insertion porin family